MMYDHKTGIRAPTAREAMRAADAALRSAP